MAPLWLDPGDGKAYSGNEFGAPLSIDYSASDLDNLESVLATNIDVAPAEPNLMFFLDEIDLANRPVNMKAIPVPQLKPEQLRCAMSVVPED